MRKYLDEKEAELDTVICNQCKKELIVKNGILKEGCFSADAVFGYFSGKDGQKHSFDLCEACYDEMIARFKVPVEKKEIKELL